MQALRALAVGLVVVYHVWPKRLPGGFIGVDVFFVISGFLITSHLLREVTRTGTLSVTRFWARRIRRLLPAAFVVLLACFVLTVTCVPQAYWPRSFVEIAASALYVENWVLAANSVDYLAAANQASIVQHFWSLSVEEQFYIVWPWLIVLALVVARRRAPVRAIAIALGLVAIASLAFSVAETAHSQPSAYFITPTRAWEFAAGGLLALLPVIAVSPAVRAAASWIGLGAIVVSAALLSGASPFPGAIALVPVLGTILVIWAGDVGVRYAPTAYSAIRPVQFVGDVSYSIYLWHWPIVTLYPLFVGGSPNLPGGILIVGISVLLGWLTKRYVEDPVRTGEFWAASRRRAYALAAVGITTTLVVTGVGSVAIQGLRARAAAPVEAFATQEQLTGAIATTLELDAWPMADQVPNNDAQAPEWVVDHCESVAEADLDRCSYGEGNRVAVVVGDSYATTYLPAIRAALEPAGWSVQVLTLAQCPLADVRVHRWGASTAFTACDEHRKWVDAQLDSVKPELIVAASSTKSTLARLMSGGRDEWSAGLAAGLGQLAAHGVPVAVIAGPPAANCEPGPLRPPSSCVGVAKLAEQSLLDEERELTDAAGLAYIDTRGWFCLEQTNSCPEQVGSTLVRADRDHLTGTYSALLGPVLRSALDAAVPQLGIGGHG